MIAYIGPVISLYKLIIDGLKSASAKVKDKDKRNIQKKIIEIQLLLESIIDNAQQILLTIKKNLAIEKFSKEETEVLTGHLYSQHRRLHLLLEHLRDDTSEEILKLFAPNIRRRIIELVHLKGGVIECLLFGLERFDETRIPIFVTTIYEWNHDRFIVMGHSDKHLKNKKVTVNEWVKEQERSVSELIDCSKELSDFIKSHMNIEDVVLYREKREK
jgi:hypothetical protein